MKIDRIIKMKNYIMKNETVSIDDLCREFSVSKNTVRRDINELQKNGIITKVYGGVKINKEERLIAYEQRNITNMQAKISIGKKAADFIEDDDVIFIDSGTTTPNIVDFICGKLVTIVTNNLEVIIKAAVHENISIYVLPGSYNKKSKSFWGLESMPSLSKYNLTKAFMAASGFTLENGATHSSPWEYEIKRTAIQRARSVFLLIDSSKFDITTLMTYCEANEFKTIITDTLPDEKFVRYFEKSGISLVVAE